MAFVARNAPVFKILVVEGRYASALLKAILECAGFEVLERHRRQLSPQMLSEADLVITNDPAPYLSSGVPVVYLGNDHGRQFRRRCSATVSSPFTLRQLFESIAAVLDAVEERATRPCRR